MRVVAALCIALAAASAPIAAQGGSAEDVTLQIARAQEVFATHGLRPAGSPFTGTLQDGAEASHRARLTAGVQYILVGVCDNDCTDFDLRLSDAAGNQVAADLEIDDTPMVRFTPTSSGAYTVQGSMASCGQNPCYYGIAVYGGASSVAAAGRAGVQPGVYTCTEVVNIYAGTTYTSGGSYPNYTSSLQTRGSITITDGDTYRVGTTSGEFTFDAASGALDWRSGSLALPQVRGGRYGPNAQTRVPELVVLTSSGQWTCARS